MEIISPYAISQVLASVALALMVLAYQQKNKSQILKFTIIGNILYALQYALLGAWSGVAVKIISTARNSYIFYKGKKLNSIIPLIIFIGAYTVMTIITFDSFLSLLPLCAVVIYSFGIYSGNEQQIRVITIISCLFWLWYNLSVFSIAGVASDVFVATSNVIAYLRYRKTKHKKTGR